MAGGCGSSLVGRVSRWPGSGGNAGKGPVAGWQDLLEVEGVKAEKIDKEQDYLQYVQ